MFYFSHFVYALAACRTPRRSARLSASATPPRRRACWRLCLLALLLAQFRSSLLSPRTDSPAPSAPSASLSCTSWRIWSARMPLRYSDLGLACQCFQFMLAVGLEAAHCLNWVLSWCSHGVTVTCAVNFVCVVLLGSFFFLFFLMGFDLIMSNVSLLHPSVSVHAYSSQ